MLSDELRTRLELLNRQPLPTPAEASPLARRPGIAPAAQCAAPKFRWGELLASRGQWCGSLAGVEPEHCSGPALHTTGQVVENTSGKHFRLQRPLAEFWPQGGAHLASNLVANPPSTDCHPELAACGQHLPGGVLFLDLETCGFAGSMVFLVGLLWNSNGCWKLDQLLARDYAEERAVLETLWEVTAQHEVLATFNGKCFDWPMVEDRSTRHLLATHGRGAAEPSNADKFNPHALRPRLIHCDLLHHARRRWKAYLPNCRLQTLERYICGRRRTGDIEGHAIPAAYHEFVRTGNDREVRAILHHNALDLVTLLEVLYELLRGPEQVEMPA